MTVIGSRHARAGTVFEYVGETDEGCAACKLRKQCHALKPHHQYRVTRVRPVEHDVCHVFDGSVKVVDVEEAPLRVHVPVAALRGTAFANHFEECGAVCALKRYCDPVAVPEGAHPVPMERVEGKVEDCKVDRDLRVAWVVP